MLLAIDSGNTNAVFGVFDGGTLRHQWRAVTDRERTAGDYSAWLTKAMYPPAASSSTSNSHAGFKSRSLPTCQPL